MKKLQQVSDIINKCVSYIGMVIFIILIVACVAQVFFRFILNNSLSWSEELARELFANGQVAFQYVDPEGRATAEAPYNPNGSSYAIEGLVSRDGQILGKMGHTERYEKNLFKNIAGEKEQSLFRNAVDYFRKN
jgi:hypothetical protein